MREEKPICWLDKKALMLLHEESLAEHGGLRGFRDEGLFESAMMRPQQILNYRADASLAELAGAYAYGIARNHPFSDGNKRAAYLALDTFCQLNGRFLQATQPDKFQVMVSLAAGELTEEALAAWIGQHLVPLKTPR